MPSNNILKLKLYNSVDIDMIALYVKSVRKHKSCGYIIIKELRLT